jgi:4-carboxymuconolactone decarboxylase
MRLFAATLFSFCLFVGGASAAQQLSIEGTNPMSKPEDVRAVAPSLENYAQKVILGDLWKRPGLSRRDRSIVTVAALIARDQTVELPYYLALALDNGVKPAEISEIITHLAFYTGWGNAINAIPAARDVFKSRNIGADQLPPASGPQLPLDEAAEKQRAIRVGEQFGQIAPSLIQYTTDVLFRDLWLRPDLAPRDRSLVTVSALIATGQVAQITYHLNRAMDNGLTREEAGEVLGHVAFYAGWPNAFSAAPVVKEVIEKRPAGK